MSFRLVAKSVTLNDLLVVECSDNYVEGDISSTYRNWSGSS